MYEQLYVPDYYVLEHHGIIGQKWGVRRYQNSDGSLTAAGRSRYVTKNKHAIDWATYKIGADRTQSHMGRHAGLTKQFVLNTKRQAAREMGEGLTDRDKASGMSRVYGRRKIANRVGVGLGAAGVAAGAVVNPMMAAGPVAATGLSMARSHYNRYKQELAASGHIENLENVHAAQLVDMHNKATGRKPSNTERAMDIGAVGIGRFDERHPAVGILSSVALSSVGLGIAAASNTSVGSLNLGGLTTTHTTYTTVSSSVGPVRHV